MKYMLLFMMMISLMLILLGCAPSEAVESEDIDVIPVKVMNPFEGEIVVETSGLGILEAEERRWVSSGVGEVAAINVAIGDYVEAGDVLFTLESTIKENTLSATESQLRTVRDTLKIQLDDLKVQLTKNETLLSTGAVAQSVVDNLKASIRQIDKQYIDASNNYRRQVANLKEDLSASFVEAPISGTIKELDIQIGEIYQNQQVVLIESSDQLKVEFPIALVQRKGLQQDAEVYVTLESDGQIVSGKIIGIAQATDESNLYDVTVRIIPETKIYPGEFVDIKIIRERFRSMLIPSKALQSFGGETFVYVHQSGLAKKVNVKTGLRQGESTEILAGLTKEMEVIVSGQAYVKDNALVSIFQ